MSNAKLTLDDIADLRAYERERDDFRAAVIALKKRRRVGVGPFVTQGLNKGQVINKAMAAPLNALTPAGSWTDQATLTPSRSKAANPGPGCITT